MNFSKYYSNIMVKSVNVFTMALPLYFLYFILTAHRVTQTGIYTNHCTATTKYKHN